MAPASLLNDLRRLLESRARAGEPVTLRSQCATQTLAQPRAATLFTPWKYDAIKEKIINEAHLLVHKFNIAYNICITLYVEKLKFILYKIYVQQFYKTVTSSKITTISAVCTPTGTLSVRCLSSPAWMCP